MLAALFIYFHFPLHLFQQTQDCGKLGMLMHVDQSVPSLNLFFSLHAPYANLLHAIVCSAFVTTGA